MEFWTSVSIDVETPKECNTFQTIQNPVNNSDTVEEDVIDEEPSTRGNQIYFP